MSTGEWALPEGRDGSDVGEYGLGKRTERGERFIEFCRPNKLMVMNTWFQAREENKIYVEKSWRQVAISN